MRNKLFQQALDECPEETKHKVQHFMDMVDRVEATNDSNAIAFGEWLLLSKYDRGNNGDYLFWWDDNYENSYSTEQLYQIFKNESNEISH